MDFFLIKGTKKDNVDNSNDFLNGDQGGLERLK